MHIIKRSTAWAMVLCLLLSLVLSVGHWTMQVNAEEYDPYVFHYGAQDQVPSYYSNSAKIYQGVSPHQILPDWIPNYSDLIPQYPMLFNLTNVERVPEEEPAIFAEDPLFASHSALCVDLGVPCIAETRYRAINLEEGHFGADQNKVAHIRAIVRQGMYYLSDPSAVQTAANKYFGSEKIVDLTASQLAAAIQAALWHYANGITFDYIGDDGFISGLGYKEEGPYLWSGSNSALLSDSVSKTKPLDAYEEGGYYSTAKYNINNLFDYFVNLPGESAEDVIITKNALSLGGAVLSGSGDDTTLTMLVKVNGTVNGDDALKLSATCGDTTETVELSNVEATADGLFPITLTDVDRDDCGAVSLLLTGTQSVDDAVYYEAEPGGGKDARYTSQNYAGYGAKGIPVQAKQVVDAAAAATTSLELTKIDEKSGNTLSGVSFDLYKKQSSGDLKIGTFVTDENGKISVSVSDTGDYYYRETAALEGYEALTGEIAPGTVSNTWTSGSLSVNKKLVNTTPAQVGETFNFKVTLDLSTALVTKNNLSWMTDTYLMEQLVCSDTVNWSVTDDMELTGTFTVDVDETVTIDGIPLGTTYTLEEELTKEDRQWFTVTTKVGDEAPVETNSATGTIAQQNALIFTNSVVTDSDLKLGRLDVSKELINTTPAQPEETFNFKITLDLSTADIYSASIPWMNDRYLLDKVACSEKLTWTTEGRKHTAEFTVDAGETVIFDSIARGTTYTVEEVRTEQDKKWFTVTTKIGEGTPLDSNIANGSIAEYNAVLFTNTVVTDSDLKLGQLSVSKKLVNTTPAQVGETFNFKITLDLSTADIHDAQLPWMNDTYLMGKVTCDKALSWNEKDGKYIAEFTVDADETVTVKGIAQGATYTVEEVRTEQDKQWFTVTTQIGEGAVLDSNIASGSVAEENAVLFTNSVITDSDLKLGKLAVSKKLINTTPAQVGETFNFKITLDLSTADIYDTQLPWVNDAYLMGKVTCDENLTWTESEGKHIATFTVDADETVTIDGIAQGATYTVEEILTEEDRNWFAVTTQVGSEDEVNGTTATSTIAQENAVLFTNSVVTEDELRLGDLSVSKKLVNTTPAQVGETFNFNITLDLSTAEVYTNPVPWMNNAYLMSQVTCEKNLSWTEADGKYTAEFTVDADETVTIKGLAYGVTYTVEEVLTDADREWFTVTSQINSDAETDSNIIESTIAQGNALTFTNSVVTGPELQLGKLEVSKKLINSTPAEVGETFNFKVTVNPSTADVYTDPAPWMNDDYLMSQITCTENLAWTQEDGKYTATFTVDADETVTIDGLAYGTAYTVEEIRTAEDREWFTVTTQIGDEQATDSNTASGNIAARNALLFTNTVVTGPELQLGKLEVSKKLINSTPAEVGETFNFKVTVNPSTADVYTDPAPWMNDDYLMSQITCTENLAWTQEDGKYTAVFTVDADETVTIDGLAYGTAYTVEEIRTAEDREWFTVTTQIGDEQATDSNTASGNIAARNALLFTNSVVTGPDLELGKLEVSKKLINTTPAEVGETFKFKVTLDLSTAVVYLGAAPWMNDEYLMSKVNSSENLTWVETNGKYTAEFTVDADETVTIDGIAEGTTYTLEEIQTEEDRIWFTTTTRIGNKKAQKGTVVTDSIATENAILFTNTVVTGPELELGKLEVSKKLVNTTPAEVGETFNFKVTLDLSTAHVYTDPAPWMNNEYLMSKITSEEKLTWTEKDGKYTAEFTVDADETVTIDGIAEGTTYTVEEIQTEEDRKWFTVTTKIGEEDAVAGTVVNGSIAEENAILFTNSVITGPELKTGKLEVSKKLVNTTPAEVGETFNFRVTLDLSTAHVYTDPAPWMNNEYLMSKITSEEKLTWTQKDGKYIAEFTVDADETVTIDGIAQGTTYTVEEVQSADDRNWYLVTTQIGEEKAVSGTTAEGSVAEKNALLFTNTVVTGPDLKTGKLEVSKKLLNATPAIASEVFNFSITVDFSTADVFREPAPWMTAEHLLSRVKSSKELTWTKSGTNVYTATFTLKADEAITIEGIAVGSNYTVQEKLTDADRKFYQVTNQITVDGITAPDNSSDTGKGSIAAENAVRFTNKYIQEDIPRTDDTFIASTVLLSLLAAITLAAPTLLRRRFI